jgi:hypothetical protein
METNIKKKELCVKLVIYKDYSEMLHGQQNVKFHLKYLCGIDRVKFTSSFIGEAFHNKRVLAE